MKRAVPRQVHRAWNQARFQLQENGTQGVRGARHGAARGVECRQSVTEPLCRGQQWRVKPGDIRNGIVRLEVHIKPWQRREVRRGQHRRHRIKLCTRRIGEPIEGDGPIVVDLCAIPHLPPTHEGQAHGQYPQHGYPMGDGPQHCSARCTRAKAERLPFEDVIRRRH